MPEQLPGRGIFPAMRVVRLWNFDNQLNFFLSLKLQGLRGGAVAMKPTDQKMVEQAVDVAVLYKLTDRLYRARAADDVYNAALDAIIGSLGCSRASILLFDEGGVMRFVASRGISTEYRERLNGHTPWQPGEPEPRPIFVSDIDRTDEPDWVKACIKSEGIRALGFVPLVARGLTVGKFMTYYELPREFTAHDIELAVTIARQVGFSVERVLAERARRTAEQQLRESQERFQLMSEHAPVMIWMSDENGGCLHLNKLLRDFWGVEEGSLAAFNWTTTMHPEDVPLIGKAMGEAMANRASVKVKGRYRDATGQYRILQTDARPRMSADGDFLGMIGVNIDITEREEAEEARRHAAEHSKLLIAELNHRVKNTLSVVQAIAYQTFRGIADDACDAFNGRLSALARAHNLLTQSSWERVTFHGLAATALQTEEGTTERIILKGPTVVLSPRHATPWTWEWRSMSFLQMP